MPIIENDMQATRVGKMLRIKLLKEELQKNKKMLESDLVKFSMNRWMLSREIAARYVEELEYQNFLTRKYENGDIYVYLVE